MQIPWDENMNTAVAQELHHLPVTCWMLPLPRLPYPREDFRPELRSVGSKAQEESEGKHQHKICEAASSENTRLILLVSVCLVANLKRGSVMLLRLVGYHLLAISAASEARCSHLSFPGCFLLPSWLCSCAVHAKHQQKTATL